jgi:hypothetical protein
MTPDEPTTCDLCWALVPRAYLTFHRDWHTDLDRHRRMALTEVAELVALDAHRRTA